MAPVFPLLLATTLLTSALWLRVLTQTDQPEHGLIADPEATPEAPGPREWLDRNETSAAGTPVERVLSVVRLPTDLKPERYDLRFFPVPTGSDVFRGFVRIRFLALNRTSEIRFHAAGLTIEDETFKITKKRDDDLPEDELKIRDRYLLDDNETMVVAMETPVMTGGVIFLSSFFTGSFVTNGYGLNRIFYYDDDTSGQPKRVLATYLQPTGARRVFPCLDEPRFKASFALSVGHDSAHTVASNMDVLERNATSDNETFWTAFRESVPMSTYLVAFVISDLKTNASQDERVRVWSRDLLLHNTSYASHLAPRVLKWLESTLALPYPIPKLDLMAMPAYVVPGMENFGLILTQEDSLTTNGKISRHEWVATVTAHEIAHQWAGNLVTPVWWNHIWISEGFATYLAAVALDKLEPGLEATKSMVTEFVEKIRNDDEGDGAFSLLAETFDPLLPSIRSLPLYFKGASLLRMLNSVIGEEYFTKAIRLFYNKFKYSIVSELDLYSCLEEAGMPPAEPGCDRTLPGSMEEILEGWIRNRGYPLVTVSRLTNGTFSIKQEMFEVKNLHDPSSTSNSGNLEGWWWVPLSFATSSHPEFGQTCPKAWLGPGNESVVLEHTENDSWIVVNIQKSSYYRVNYDSDIWHQIALQLLSNHSSIHVLNRAALIQDAFYLFQTGHAGIESAMGMLKYISKEESFFPLQVAFKPFKKIEVLMRDNEQYHLLKKFFLDILSPLVEGQFGTSMIDVKRYQLIMSWACRFHHPKCVKEARQTFQFWKETGDFNIFPETGLEEYLCVAIWKGTQDDWIFLFQRFLTETNRVVKRAMRDALACSNDQTIIHMYLDDAATQCCNIVGDDVSGIMNSVARSHLWNKYVWKYIYNNWERLQQIHGEVSIPVPLPFVETRHDFEQVNFVLEQKFSHLSSDNPGMLESFLLENEETVERNSRVSDALSAWLFDHVHPSMP